MVSRAVMQPVKMLVGKNIRRLIRPTGAALPNGYATASATFWPMSAQRARYTCLDSCQRSIKLRTLALASRRNERHTDYYQEMLEWGTSTFELLLLILCSLLFHIF